MLEMGGKILLSSVEVGSQMCYWPPEKPHTRQLLGNQASDILLLKKLFVLILKYKFNQSNEKVGVLL